MLESTKEMSEIVIPIRHRQITRPSVSESEIFIGEVIAINTYTASTIFVDKIATYVLIRKLNLGEDMFKSRTLNHKPFYNSMERAAFITYWKPTSFVFT